MLHQVKVALRVQFVVWLLTAHNRGSSRTQRIVPLLFSPGRFFEKDFAQHLFFFPLIRLIILHIAVVWLVVNCRAVVVAVRVLIAHPTHVVHYLRLSGVWAQRNLGRVVVTTQLRRLEGLVRRHVLSSLRSEVLAGQEQHLLVETTDYWNFRWAVRFLF